MSKQPPPAPTASTVGPCPIIIQIVGRPGTGSLPRTIAPPDHPLKVSKAAEASRLELKNSVLQCLPPSTLNIESETTCNIIPEYVPIPISKLSSVSLPSSDSTSTFVKCSDPFYQDQPVIAYPVCEGVELNSNGSILEDSRVVTVAGSDNENLHDCGIEADIVEIDG